VRWGPEREREGEGVPGQGEACIRPCLAHPGGRDEPGVVGGGRWLMA